MEIQTIGWMNEWMNRQTDILMDWQMDTDGTDRKTWIDRQVDGRMDGQRDRYK